MPLDQSVVAETPNSQTMPTTRTVALVGNPNTGKTTLFNALTGYRRRVANYPGVTVDVAHGAVRGVDQPLEILDLPGTYSLAAVSPDEMVVSNLLSGRIEGRARPDCILAILDASNLRRNLYLVTQLAELGLPMVLALNMVDIASSRGLEIDCEKLSERLGMPVVPLVATQEATVEPLKRALLDASVDGARARTVELPQTLRDEAAALSDVANLSEAIRILLDRDGHAEKQFFETGGSRERIAAARERLASAGIEGAPVEVRARYAWIDGTLEGVITRPDKPVATWSDRLDRILTHKFGGAAVLLGVLTLLFQAIFQWATPLMDLIGEGLFPWLQGLTSAVLPAGALRSLISDGIIGGVGFVLIFLPQILILFALIAVLEDCGYMARAAFMMDRIMQAAGLSGRSFIPLLSSFACAVPAIMGTRVIPDRRDRFVTILILPFMSCSARLPVYVLMIGAFVPKTYYFGGWIGLPGLVMLGMYLVGVAFAIPIAWLLKKTVFRAPTPGFMLELPTYKLPRLRAVWQRMYMSGKRFVVRAGTVILVVNIVVWALGYWPRNAAVEQRVRQTAATEGWDEQRLNTEINGAYLRDSFLARAGRAIEPAIKPLGWDWRIGAAVVASFPAREVVIGTLGTIFNLANAADDQAGLKHALQRATWAGTDKPLFTLPVALSLMVFFALCAQCSSTLIMMGREMGSWVWPVISFVGMTSIAYVAALVVAVAARAWGG